MTLARRSPAWPLLIASLALLLPTLVVAQGIEAPRVPVRTAHNELRALRQEYADAFNKKDAAAVAAMYATDATAIWGDGTALEGRQAIQQRLEAGPWGKMSIASDTVRVYGNTAVDMGTVRMSVAGGDEQVSHYLVVLRRGVKEWKVNSLAVVPEMKKASTSDSTSH